MNILQWNELPDGIASNADPIDGGIIDRNIVTREWFCIFNDDAIPNIDGIATREEAFNIFSQKLTERDARRNA